MKMIPEIRFPEFANNGKWDNKPISKLGETVNGLSGKKGADFGSGRPYVQYKQVFDKSFIDFTECGKVDVGDDENQNQLQLGDILFTTSSETPDEVGFASVITKQPNEPTYLNSFCFILRPNDLDEINPDFSRYLFHSPIYRKSVSAIAQGSTRYNLSKGSFLKLRVPIPKPEEQQKIASCLSSLDELLAAHKDKLDALKNHKKGLLQNLFPQEGETVPKVRFPEFEGDGEWVETTLEEMADYENGKAHEKNIDENGNYIVVNSKFISSEGETVKYSNTAFCPASEGDILMVLSDIPNGKAIAKCFYVDEDDKYSVNQRICRITATNCDSRFLFYIMDRNAYFLSFDDGVKQTNLRKSDVLEFPFRIPTDPVEQTKIASCITAVDDLIKSQSAKIEELNQHKRGLMQGLFPKIKS